jgi:hypothetical protein
VLLLLPAAMFVYSSRGKWVFPPLTSFPTPGCWVRALLPPEALRPAQLVYLQSWEGFPSPNLQHSGHPTLFPACLNCSYYLLLSFSFFFSRVEVSLSRGLCCSGPGLSVGLPWYREAHLVRVFPSHVGTGHWRPRGPSSFLCLTWSGDSLHRLEMWRGQSYAFSRWLCLQSVSPASLQDFTIVGLLSASYL